MPIQEQNIVFVASQVMDDVPEGGGAATGSVIVDGQMNNVFEDISDLDRAYGRFNLRKIFLAVRTLSTDLYGGAKTVVTALPTDDALGYTLFSSGDPFDTRAQAADRVEAYLYKGPMWAGYLYENHIQGMRAINLIQKVGSVLPPVGKTLTLVADEGAQGEVEQYVRVIKVQYSEQFFVDGIASDGSDTGFTRWIVTLTLSDALRFDFKGHTIKRADGDYKYTAGETRIRNTTVADATRYFGAQRLALAANIGDLQVKAASQFTKLVPSAQTETPLVNQVLNPSVVVTMSAGTRNVDIAQQAHTLGREVTVENRRLNWIETLAPIPAPGTLSVAYRAQDNWYELLDNGSGQLVGSDPSIGAGTLNYTTGAMAVTLGALPDAYSTVIMTWGSPVHYAVRAGATSDADTRGGRVRITLDNTPVVPASLTVRWTLGAAEQTATAASGGTISAAGMTGSVDPIDGVVELFFTALPDRDTAVVFDYDYLNPDDPETPAQVRLTLPMSATGHGVDLGQAVAPGSVTVQATYSRGGYWWENVVRWGAGIVRIEDDGAGNLVVAQGQTLGVNREDIAGAIVGSVDYASGLANIDIPIVAASREWSGVAQVYVVSDADFYPVAGTSATAVIDTGAPSTALSTSQTYLLAEAGLEFDLTASVTSQVVPNSVRFTAGGKTYEDRNGDVVTDIDAQTGSALSVGALDYDLGLGTIRQWDNGSTWSIAVSSCLTRYGDWTAVESSFRTAVAPLKPESISLVAVTLDGEQITGAADPDGVITGTWMRGAVNYEFGTASVEFGQMAGDPPVWTPREVDPASIRYNAVSYSYLPLDADILGIDPVRLPSDGRVPIYRPGDVVMVMHAADTAPQTVLTDGTIDCGRTRLAWVRVTDATGASVATGYTLDRATGVVTFTDITGIAMPVTIRHTVADLRQITDAQISGQLTLARPLTHAYPAGESIVASCLIHGDRRARVSATWDQATWSGTWSDALDGSEATATLDTIAHPITVTNEGAETERWLLRWTSTTAVELIGERRGLVYSGPFTANIAPINPRTRNTDGTGGVPYLTIPLAANGGGWSAGNVVRINTVGALADIWIARSIQQSDEPAGDGADGCELYALGNIDRP